MILFETSTSLYAIRLCPRLTFYKLPTPGGLHRVYKRKTMKSLLDVRLGFPLLQYHCSSIGSTAHAQTLPSDLVLRYLHRHGAAYGFNFLLPRWSCVVEMFPYRFRSNWHMEYNENCQETLTFHGRIKTRNFMMSRMNTQLSLRIL